MIDSIKKMKDLEVFILRGLFLKCLMYLCWTKIDIIHVSFEGAISFRICFEYVSVRLIDIMDGSIYEIPDSIVKRDAHTVAFTLQAFLQRIRRSYWSSVIL